MPNLFEHFFSLKSFSDKNNGFEESVLENAFNKAIYILWINLKFELISHMRGRWQTLFSHLSQESARFLLECTHYLTLYMFKRIGYFPFLNGKKNLIRIHTFDIESASILLEFSAHTFCLREKKESNKVQIGNQCRDTDKWRNPPGKTFKQKQQTRKHFVLKYF